MADNDTLNRPTKKFLFDVNNFDEPEGPDPDAPPPPPMFSVDELEGAKLSSFEQGRAAGLAEAKASREKFVADLVQTVTANFRTLFDAEAKRAAQYEGEVLLVTKAIFEKLFPALNDTHGLAEVNATIAAVLENHRHQREIVIEVNSEFTNDVREMADLALKSLHGAGTVTVIANDALARGDCRMGWNDGGAERSATALSAQIRKTLDEALADRPRLQDNREEAPRESDRESGHD
jgi:flagellar assembly protein FliH